MDVLPKALVQNILETKWFSAAFKFIPPNNSDDLCLLFCLYPSSML